MKKLKFCSLLIGCVGLLASCSNNEEPQTLEELTQNNRKVVKRTMPVDVLLAHPYQIQYLEGYLLWVDRTKEKLLTVYDLQANRTLVQLINEGKGPNEILSPLQLLTDPQQKTVGLLQRQTNQYAEYRFEDMLRDSLVRTNRFTFDLEADMCHRLNREHFIVGGIVYDTVASAVICDTLGKVVRWINTYPSEIMEIENPSDRYMKGCSSMAYLPEEQVLCVAYTSFLDRIQFFDMSGTEPTLVREYGVPELKEKYTPSSLCTYATDRFIYVLWMNNLDKERYIIQFDSAGGVADCIEVGPKAYRFCVTPDDTKIYTLEQDSAAMPVVAEYRLR